MIRRRERVEQFQMALPERNETTASRPATHLLAGPGVLKDISGNRATGECGMAWLGWNGDRSRGWGFYCACGFCTPMRRSFSEGLDEPEKHWHREPARARLSA